jgi:ABC-type molybdate transport system ATPase subunit
MNTQANTKCINAKQNDRNVKQTWQYKIFQDQILNQNLMHNRKLVLFKAKMNKVVKIMNINHEIRRRILFERLTLT